MGSSAQRQVFMGFAPAKLLYSLSFADALDEDTGRGYQRRFNSQHSLDFRKYIQSRDSSTIPLTFNLRPEYRDAWRVRTGDAPAATLVIDQGRGKVLSQVDCQHRLGYLNDSEVSLPFMTYIGLSAQEEMEVFNIINSKARGLSASLLDFHDATLATDLAADRPELFVALHLKDNPASPWYRQVDLGGSSTSGLMRRASLRTMQKAIKRFLMQTKILQESGADVATQTILNFWAAVVVVLRAAWDEPRRHLITKGVGVYALTTIAGDLYLEYDGPDQPPDKHYFVAKLAEFITDIDWTNKGPLSGFGGQSGVMSALSVIRNARAKALWKVANG
jgi:DGQHR domain-containing protein